MNARFLALPLTLVGVGAVAHVVTVMKGVHFKTEAMDFGQPPLRRSDSFDDGTGGDEAWRPGTQYRRGIWEEDEARESRDAADLKRLMRQASVDEGSGRLDAARAAYRTLRGRGLGDPAFLGARLELLSTLGIAGARGLGSYLRATHPLTRGPLPGDVAPALRPWVAYARSRSAADYAEVARRYPASSRAAAALIMAARGEVNVPDPGAVRGGLVRARQAARTLLARYPDSRFAWDARGILGRVEFLGGHLAQARARYEEQVLTADSPARRANALQSIIACDRRNRPAVAYAALRWTQATDEADPYVARTFLLRTLGRFAAGDAPAFYARLEGDPASFAAYLELRASLDAKASDVLALAVPAQRATQRTPYRASVAATLARVALARNDARAGSFAATAADGKGADAAAGRFILATLARRSGDLRRAQAQYARVAASGTYLAGGARENLAIVDERLGDLQGAMDQYLRLGYAEDVAYLADARMNPQELAQAVARHPDRPALRYTLAMRHLRRGEWDAAETTLRPFSDAQRKRLTVTDAQGYFEDGGLQDPLQTARSLRALDATVEAAKEPEAKAAALSAMGDYYYRHKCLLLYSGPAWKGGRAYTFGFSWNPAVATEADDAALRAHHDEHECYAQALRCFRRVVEEFLDTKAAPHAAYWGAVAAERLSNMAPYWRWREGREDRKGEAVRLLAFAARSPDPALAAKARKYGKVFADERAEARKAFENEKAPARRWDPFAE